MYWSDIGGLFCNLHCWCAFIGLHEYLDKLLAPLGRFAHDRVTVLACFDLKGFIVNSGKCRLSLAITLLEMSNLDGIAVCNLGPRANQQLTPIIPRLPHPLRLWDTL